MTEKNIIRNKVWANLRSVAYPDPCFHWDFSAFIPDFGGSDRCAIGICKSREYAKADCIFITPDNSLTTVRKQAILDKKHIIVPTDGIQRGFWQIKPREIPQRQDAFAATLDGLESFAHPYHLKSGEQLTKPDILMTCASILNTKGVRISDTPSYFDLEWLILYSLDLVEDKTPILACVHDYQVVDFDLPLTPFGVVVDYIYTPKTFIQIDKVYPRPADEARTH